MTKKSGPGPYHLWATVTKEDDTVDDVYMRKPTNVAPGLRVVTYCRASGYTKVQKKADKQAAQLAVDKVLAERLSSSDMFLNANELNEPTSDGELYEIPDSMRATHLAYYKKSVEGKVGQRCPHCDCMVTYTVDSRSRRGITRRRRVCPDCNRRHSTVEIPLLDFFAMVELVKGRIQHVIDSKHLPLYRKGKVPDVE